MTKLRQPRWITYQRSRRERFRAEGRRGGDHILGEGRLQQDRYIVVTRRRIIWEEGRRAVSLPFDAIEHAGQVIYDTHRYELFLFHQPIDRPRETPLPWDIPHHWRRFKARHLRNRQSVLRFSRRDTAAAQAIREELARRGIRLGPDVVRPHHREEHEMVYRHHPGRRWSLGPLRPPDDPSVD